jgi:2'-5' RNA ligase
MRVFLALSLPDHVTETLSALVSKLPVGRVVPADNMHLTLAFLGELSDAAIEAAHEAMETVHARRFDLQLHGFDTFGGRAPKVVHIGARPDPALADLHRTIRSRLHGAGLMLPRERFVPHVTLARLPATATPDEMQLLAGFLAAHGGMSIPAFPVTSFTLYRSTLRPDGAVHDPLAHYPLA